MFKVNNKINPINNNFFIKSSPSKLESVLFIIDIWDYFIPENGSTYCFKQEKEQYLKPKFFEV